MYFSLFHNYLPLEKGEALHLKKTWIPFTQGCFVPSLVEIDQVVLEKKMKMWKVYNNNNDLYTNDDANNDDNENNNDDEQRTNFDKKGLLELKIMKIWYIINFTLLCINTFIFDAYQYLYFSCHWPQYIVTHTDLWKLDFELLIWSFINSQFFIIVPIKIPSFGQILLQIILIHFDDTLLIGKKPSTNIRL